MVHITGGGFQENIPRMFPSANLGSQIDVNAWHFPDIFAYLQQAGNVAHEEMLRTFNCGVGFLLCVDPSDVDEVTKALTDNGEQPFVIGKVVERGTDPAVVFV